MSNILEPWRNPRIIFYLYICDPEDIGVDAPEPLLPEHLPALASKLDSNVKQYSTDCGYYRRHAYEEIASLAAYGLAMLDGWDMNNTISYLERVEHNCPDEAEVVLDMREERRKNPDAEPWDIL